MSDITEKRIKRRESMNTQVQDMLENPVKTLWARLIVSFMVAIITGGISAYISVQIISGEVKTLSDNQHTIAQTQQLEFQELSQRIDNLVDANRPPPRP